MYNNEGIRSFFRGYSASLLLCSLGVIHMVSYEALKSLLANFRSVDVRIKDFIAGSGGRFVASTLCYPLVLIRSRLQQKQYRLASAESLKEKEILYNTLRDGFKITYRREGLKGFYKGYLTTILRTTPQQGIFFAGFEATMRFLNRLEMS
eukprot:TRINITY_DN14678_c0_g1_i5.p1 TRINITY_DN14678_c0_g1~~TRINITY_DN14678_c0_g1_i5.p1  ORF type:complete len:150 (-),score=12.11 TRINITY_DN14678_c0_g1_i5:209-658(-)